jgi:preprotein translocase subunit SecF
VTVVILLFLQDWRSLLLPVIGVVVSLVGTFAVMSVMGFTLNNLTLFGLILAIGIVVDDAIVVLENIERWMEKGLPARGNPQPWTRSPADLAITLSSAACCCSTPSLAWSASSSGSSPSPSRCRC